MARTIDKLTPLGVSRQSKPGYYGDGAGLWLQVAKTSNPNQVSKSWIFRFTLRGKAQEMGLGPLHTITLAEAREAATVVRKLLRDGINPIEHRRIAKREMALADARCKTFEWCAIEYHRLHEKTWKNSKHAAQWISTLKTYAFPKFGSRSINEVSKDDILTVLNPIWLVKTETATRVHQRIRTVLDWAGANDYRNNSEPRFWEEISGALPKLPSKDKRTKSFAACSHRMITTTLKAIKQSSGGETQKQALEFIILTAARTGEVRGAVWSEIDFDRARWVIPANRMKADVEHRVPLSRRALDILEAQKGKHETLVFPSDRKKPFSDMAFTMTLRRLGFNFTVHGFRSTFRDWSAEETSHPREVCEAALAHKSSKSATEAAYFRSDLFEKRRLLMEDWAKYCEGDVSEGESA